MKFNIGDKVRIVPPKEVASFAKNLSKVSALGTVTDYNSNTNGYEVEFRDKFRDWYFVTWLEKVEEDTNIPQQPTVPPMPKKEMDWSKIKEMTEMALVHNKDIVITINADGSKEIEISTPTTSIVETQMRTRYVPEGDRNNE